MNDRDERMFCYEADRCIVLLFRSLFLLFLFRFLLLLRGAEYFVIVRILYLLSEGSSVTSRSWYAGFLSLKSPARRTDCGCTYGWQLTCYRFEDLEEEVDAGRGIPSDRPGPDVLKAAAA